MVKATLLVIQGADQGTRFEIGEEPVGIGRAVGNALRILDTEVSRRHAAIEYADHAYCVTDLDSSNGTFVNGEPVRLRQLKSGDQLQIGRSLLLFNEVGEADESVIAADKIDLVGKSGPSDTSKIVGSIGHDGGADLLGQLETPGGRELAQTLANLQVLYRISEEAVSPTESVEQLLGRILDLTIQAVGADRGCMLLSDPETSDIVPQVFGMRRGGGEADGDAKMPVSRSIVDYVLEHRQGVRTSDARSDHRFDPGQSILQAGIREALCVPMQGRYELRGVIYLDTTTPPERVVLQGGAIHKFSDEHLRLLIAIGRESALMVENRRYQQALVKAERLAAVGQTIAMLSHHIKNILQGVRGGSYLIDMGLNDHNEDLVRKGWNIVEKNQGKIYHLVTDMLTFSTERVPALRRAELNDTVGEVCELIHARAAECGVKFEAQLTPEIPSAMFDPEGIHRAVLNIVTNAIDAVEGTENGFVRVESGFDAALDNLFVAVSDNGPGIPADQLSKIFHLFESTKGARGTGLGLAVSQKIIREHGGEISVVSEPGNGCRFVLSWPRNEDEPYQSEPPTQL